MTTQANNPRRTAICSLGASFGLLLIAISTLIPLLNNSFEGYIYRYIFTAGAIIALLAALFTPAIKDNLRERRWQRIESWSAIFFCAAAVFLYLPEGTPRDWLAFTLAGATLRIICFFRATFKSSKKN